MSDSPTTFDDDYYFTTITFRVEGTLFRVPRHHFIEQSEVFRDMFELPIASDAVPDGSSDEQPGKLDGVSRTDFRQLLRVMFPRRLLSAEIFTTHQWTSVLRLCALWQMQDLAGQVLTGLSTTAGSRDDWTALLDLSVERELPEARRLAIEKITNTFGYNEGIDRVVLGRKYRVRDWLLKGLENLVQQHQFFSDAEMQTLGIETVLKLCPLREVCIRRQSDNYYYGYSGSSNATIEDQFQDELLEMDN